MAHGFVIPLAADISIEDGRFSWDWDYEESPVSFHFATQARGSPLERDGNAKKKFKTTGALKLLLYGRSYSRIQ